ncbi:MAG: MBL fold metallo-hydrolase [Opitutales bacterium]|nr:MBL fold metallo-hydrolase [Opitutales bacterium]
MSIPLEDYYEDILGKAQRGLGLTDQQVCSRADISEEKWKHALDGKFDETTARAVAPVLSLGADALVTCGKRAWKPDPVSVDGLRQCNTTFDDMTVNAYVVWNPRTRAAVVFDSGADARPLLDTVRERNLTVRQILLTHSHPDHVADLQGLRNAFPDAPIAIHRRETVTGADPFEEGAVFEADGLKIAARLTAGHSPGGATFVIEGLERPVAIVGDALFAGSMGGAPSAWNSAIAATREKILGLPENTVLCPGHGPLTTVAAELENNPLFAK